MNPTADRAGGLVAPQSNAESLSSSGGLSGPEMASRAGFEPGSGPVCGYAAPGPSYLIYESNSITPDATRVYEGNQEIVSEANGPKGIQGFPDRLKRFANRHCRAEEMASFLQLQEQPYARRRARKLRE